MTSPSEHNPAAYDPAVLYWDWERAKILNRTPLPGNAVKYPPGLGISEQSPWDKPYFQRPGKSRAGTLRRANAFSEDQKPQPATSHKKTTSIEATSEKDKKPVPPVAKPDFPETLYSGTKRKVIEDMGNKFIENVKRLDRGEPGELVDFNSILESHWTQLAKFYSDQVSVVRMLEQKIKPIPLGFEKDLAANPSPQLPAYLISRLEEYKTTLFALVCAKLISTDDEPKQMLTPKQPPQNPSEKPGETSFAPFLKSEAGQLFVPGGSTSRPMNYGTNEENHLVTPGKPRKLSSTKETNCVTMGNPKLVSLDKADGMAHSTNLKAGGSAEASPDEIRMEGISKGLKIIPGILKEVISTPNTYTGLDAPTNSGGPVTTQHNDIPDAIWGTGKAKWNPEKPYPDGAGNSSYCKTVNTVNTQSIAKFSMEAGLKDFMNATKFKGTKETSISSTNKISTNTDSNVSRVENKNVDPGKADVNTNDAKGTEGDKGRNILVSRDPELDIEATTEENPKWPCPFKEDQLNDSKNDRYRSDSSEVGNRIPSLEIGNENLDSSNTLPEADSATNNIYDTAACTPREITPRGVGITPSSSHTALPTQEQIKSSISEEAEPPLKLFMTKSLLQDSNYDSYSVSDNSSLSFGSTKRDLEQLQMEVTDHLERVERIGGSFVARWIDGFGVKRENNAEESGEDVVMAPTIGKGEGGSHDKKDFVTEDYGFDDSEDEEDDEEMEEILAGLRKTEEDIEADDMDKTIYDPKDAAMNSDDPQPKRLTDNKKEHKKEGDGNGWEEDTGEEEDLKVTKRSLFEKGLSTVDEEEDEDEKEEEKEDHSDDSGDDSGDESDNEDIDEEDSGFEELITGSSNIDGGNVGGDKKEEVDTKETISEHEKEPIKAEAESKEGPKGDTKKISTETDI